MARQHVEADEEIDDGDIQQPCIASGIKNAGFRHTLCDINSSSVGTW
jgi:hypothetical protein